MPALAQAHPSTPTVNLHPLLYFYLVLCLAFLLPGSSSSLLLLLLGSLLPGPLSYLAPFFSACFSQVPFTLVHSLASSSGQRCGMLRNGGRVRPRARGMRRVEGWNAMGYASATFLSQCIFNPHTHVHINCNIINISNKTHF